MNAAELDKMLRRATDGGDHEWGWYVDDVPRLVARIRELEDELAAATDECHTLYARVYELEHADEVPESPPIAVQDYILGAGMSDEDLDRAMQSINSDTATLTRADLDQAFEKLGVEPPRA